MKRAEHDTAQVNGKKPRRRRIGAMAAVIVAGGLVVAGAGTASAGGGTAGVCNQLNTNDSIDVYNWWGSAGVYHKQFFMNIPKRNCALIPASPALDKPYYVEFWVHGQNPGHRVDRGPFSFSNAASMTINGSPTSPTWDSPDKSKISLLPLS